MKSRLRGQSRKITGPRAAILEILRKHPHPLTNREILAEMRKGSGECNLATIYRSMHLLEKMHPREATVLRMRFGLDDEEPKTLKEIGERLGLTRERVRQIESEALSKLSESMQAD